MMMRNLFQETDGDITATSLMRLLAIDWQARDNIVRLSFARSEHAAQDCVVSIPIHISDLELCLALTVAHQELIGAAQQNGVDGAWPADYRWDGASNH